MRANGGVGHEVGCHQSVDVARVQEWGDVDGGVNDGGNRRGAIATLTAVVSPLALPSVG